MLFHAGDYGPEAAVRARTIERLPGLLAILAGARTDWLDRGRRSCPAMPRPMLRWMALYPADGSRAGFRLSDTPRLERPGAHDGERSPLGPGRAGRRGAGPDPRSPPRACPTRPEGSATWKCSCPSSTCSRSGSARLSSHTMGPLVAAARFLDHLRAQPFAVAGLRGVAAWFARLYRGRTCHRPGGDPRPRGVQPPRPMTRKTPRAALARIRAEGDGDARRGWGGWSSIRRSTWSSTMAPPCPAMPTGLILHRHRCAGRYRRVGDLLFDRRRLSC